MKKILYFDCFSGISGDMTLGALIDLGLSADDVSAELAKLHVDGYTLSVEKTERSAICGTNVTVALDSEAAPDAHCHSHGHSHQHVHCHDNEHDHAHSEEHRHADARNLHDITHIIQDSTISDYAKELSLRIFREIALAEAAVHGKPLEEVHFHEVGAVDSIVDIVGTAICLDMLAIDEIHCSTVQDGHGFVRCQHGLLPVPVPAVAKMMEGCAIRLQTSDRPGELVTPTGFGILKAAAKCGSMPEMNVEKIGYGFGKRDTGALNALRVFLGTAAETSSTPDNISEKAQAAPDCNAAIPDFSEDCVTVLECTMDDERGEILGYVLEQLMENGALDAYFTPVYMKKGRPGILLTALCSSDKRNALTTLILKETSTLGVRYHTESRFILPRRTETLHTSLGDIAVKASGTGSCGKQKPEFEDCARLAEKHKLPLREVYRIAEKEMKREV